MRLEPEDKQFEIHDLEIREGNKIDVYGVATFVPELCECDGTLGHEKVTHKWHQWNLEEIEIESIHYWADDGGTLFHLPLRSLTEEDYRLIKDLIPPYEP
jgi:hypothetical protein